MKSKTGRELKTDYGNVYSRVYHGEIKKGTSVDKACISSFLLHTKVSCIKIKISGCRLANLLVKLHVQPIQSEVTILLNRSDPTSSWGEGRKKCDVWWGRAAIISAHNRNPKDPKFK